MTLSFVEVEGVQKKSITNDYNGIYFPLHTPNGVGEIKFFDRDPTLWLFFLALFGMCSWCSA